MRSTPQISWESKKAQQGDSLKGRIPNSCDLLSATVLILFQEGTLQFIRLAPLTHNGGELTGSRHSHLSEFTYRFILFNIILNRSSLWMFFSMGSVFIQYNQLSFLSNAISSHFSAVSF